MNGPSIMYRLPPLFKLEDVEVPNCMYNMKNIQQLDINTEQKPRLSNGTGVTSKTSSCSPSILEQKPLAELGALEKRQEEVLKQLSALKQQMSVFQDVLKNKVFTKSHHHTIIYDTMKVPVDIVINANPVYPPYSLLAVFHRCKTSINLHVSCHVHSTIQTIPKELNQAFHLDGYTSRDSDCIMNVTLIWKNVHKDVELVMPSTSSIAIRGEVNVLRFLSLAIPELSTTDAISATTEDALLDSCHALLWASSSRERQALLRTLSSSLNKSQYFMGDKSSIVDIAVWSVLKQLSATQDLTANMSKWYQQCNKLFMINVF